MPRPPTERDYPAILTPDAYYLKMSGFLLPCIAADHPELLRRIFDYTFAALPIAESVPADAKADVVISRLTN